MHAHYMEALFYCGGGYIYTMPDTEALFPYTRWCTMPTNGGIMYTQCGEVVVFARVNTIHTIHGGGVVDT